MKSTATNNSAEHNASSSKCRDSPTSAEAPAVPSSQAVPDLDDAEGRTSHSKSLGRAAARGGTGALAGQLGKALIQILGLILLARALPPDAFGVLAMVIGVVGITEVMRDLGLTTAVVQARSISNHQVSQIFWVNFVLGLVLAALLVLSADLIAALYRQTEVASVLRVVAVVFVLNAIAAQYRALLMRQMRFTALAAVDVSGQALALVLALVLAYTGMGYWALAIQQVVQSALILAGVVNLSKWRPSWPRMEFRDIVPFLRFGAYYAVTQVVIFASNNASTVILGRLFGPHLLGIYDRAFMVATTPSNQLAQPASNVAIATLAKTDMESGSYHRMIRRGIVAIVIPVFGVLAVCVPFAPRAVELVLGESWILAGPILQVLAIGTAFQVLGFASFWIFISTGNTRSNFFFTVMTRSVAIVVITFGATYGVSGAAWAYSISMSLIWPAGLLWLKAILDINTGYLLALGCRQFAGWAGLSGCIFLALGADGWLQWAPLAAYLLLAIVGRQFGMFRQDWNDMGSVANKMLNRRTPMAVTE
ncbi:lipopolysaccharide biosynthesis protein [Gordonia alkanivorans]|uniref:lipopolysaccharide biosynthesis protein n=1 Tax=Gordonia alkanivorans TaxID=84096 RepID=UPI001F4EEECC|nr:lipopolysaccharide biosynthesis protein [Gordonia alkanivorans]